MFLLFPPGTQKFWIISGQHSYTASQNIRKQKEEKRQPLPRYTTTFRCTIVRPDTPFNILERISGRSQAQSSNIRSMSFSETIRYLWEKVKIWRLQNPNKEVNRMELLRDTYANTGKNISRDNTVVCTLSMRSCG